MKSAYEYIKENLRSNLKDKLVEWRKQPVISRVEKPFDILRARNLGYKDKKGFVVARVRLRRGGRKNPVVHKGRRSKRQSPKKVLKMNYQWVAEQRASRRYSNLEVLNSYKVGKDGKNYFFEVIMVDPQRHEIQNDKNLAWITSPENRNRPLRGLTSAAKKSRGLRHKKHEAKVRPSLRAWNRRGK